MPQLSPARDLSAVEQEGYQINIGDRLNEAIELFKSRIGELIGFGAVVMGVSFVLVLIPIINILGGLIIGCVVAPLAMGSLLSWYFRLMKGENVTFNDLLSPGDKAGSLILAGILLSIGYFFGVLACGIGAFFVGWFVIFTYPLVVDRDLAPFEAIKTSYRLVKRNYSESVVLFLIMLGLLVAGAMLAGIGTIVTMPFAMCVLAVTYAHILGLGGVAASSEPETSAEPSDQL